MSKDSSKKLDPISVPGRQWGVGAIALGVLAFMLSQVVVAELFYGVLGENLSNAQQLYMYATSSLLSMSLLSLILRRYHTSLPDLGLGRYKPKYALLSIAGWPVYVLVGYVCIILATILVPHFNSNEIQDLGFDEVKGLPEMIAVFVALVIIPPLVEELLFRGFIFRGLLGRFKPVTAAVATSLLFGIAHAQWNVGVDTFSLSLVLCYLAYKTKSLWPSIGLHMVKNAIAFVFAFLITPSQFEHFLLKLTQ